MQTALMCFELVAKVNRVPVDMESIARNYGIYDRELSHEELLRIAKCSGFRARRKHLPLEMLVRKYPLPAIIENVDGGYFVLLKTREDEDSLLVFMPSEKEVRKINKNEFIKLYSGFAIVVAHRSNLEQVKFGFMWFYSEILNYKNIVTEVLIASFMVQVFGLAGPLFIQVIIDKVLTHQSMSTLNVLAVAFLGIVFFEFILNLIRNYLFVHAASKIDAKLGAKLFRHLLALPYVYFENRKVGNIVARVRELDNIRDFITNKTISVVIDLLFSSIFIVVMLLHSVVLTLIVLAFVLAIAILFFIVTPELRRRLEQKFQMGAHSQSYLVESVTGIQTVKSLAIEGAIQKKWDDYLGNYVNSSFKLSNMSKIAGSLSDFLQKIMTITILYLGVGLVLKNEMSIGQLIAFNMFSRQLTGPIIRLVNLWHEFQQALMSVDRLCDILECQTELQNSQAITLPRLGGKIFIDNVVFRYLPDTPNVLDRISITINPGMSVGFVGRSGSGKSTIAKIIQRLYTVKEGSVYIDGIDVRHLSPTWLRSNIGVVLQENYLFSGTIKENIAISRPDAPMEHIIEVARLAGAHEFISEMPDGYDTHVGERGSSLSGGQRQRIAIARALITKPKLLIFDEATSALDYETERIIQNNLKKIKTGRTTIFIAHRLTAVRHCDVVYVIEKGRILEGGTHDELLKKRGAYHQLYTYQQETADG